MHIGLISPIDTWEGQKHQMVYIGLISPIYTIKKNKGKKKIVFGEDRGYTLDMHHGKGSWCMSGL